MQFLASADPNSKFVPMATAMLCSSNTTTLTGANMQCQALLLVKAEAPYIGAGIEAHNCPNIAIRITIEYDKLVGMRLLNTFVGRIKIIFECGRRFFLGTTIGSILDAFVCGRQFLCGTTTCNSSDAFFYRRRFF
jgi:hypothetical protein